MSCQKGFTITVGPPPTANWFYWDFYDTVNGDNTTDRVNSLALSRSANAGFAAGLYGDGIHIPYSQYTSSTESLTSPSDPVSGNYGNSLLSTAEAGMSLAFWFKFGQINGTGMYFSYEKGDVLGVLSGHKIEVSIFGGTNYATLFDDYGAKHDVEFGPVDAGSWHFFHLYFDPSSSSLGIEFDGSLAGTASGVTWHASPSGYIYCFTDVASPYGPLGQSEMFVDEMFLSLDKKLTDTQSSNLYNGGAGQTWPIVGVR